MAGSPDSGSDTVERFSRGSRLVHWAHAGPFVFLLITGLVLYIPSIKAVNVGSFRLVPLLHVAVGLVFIASPIPIYLRLPDRSRVRRDAARLFRIEQGDAAWAGAAFAGLLGAKTPRPPAPKFNAGQKLNTVFSVLVTGGLMTTGAILAVNFFTKRVFSIGFVEAVFPLHDLFMLTALPVVVAHIYLGSLHPSTRESFRGITGGRVSRRWAREHHPRWVDEIESR